MIKKHNNLSNMSRNTLRSPGGEWSIVFILSIEMAENSKFKSEQNWFTSKTLTCDCCS